MLSKERVTVCIPHLRRENLLKKCLKSLKNSVDVPYRILIINDGERPLFFADKRIEVVNNLERRGLGSARRQFAELVKTEFMFALDNDVLVLPGSLEVQIDALDQNPQLAAVSGLHFSLRRFCQVADFEFIGDTVKKKLHDPVEIFASGTDLFEADFIPISHTTFRMKAIEDITLDPAYIIGYDHLDTFMQFYYTDWKCAIHKRSHFLHLHQKSPKKYSKERFSETLLKVSRRHFIEKWGYKFAPPREVRAGTIRKILKRLISRRICLRGHVYMLAMYTRGHVYQKWL